MSHLPRTKYPVFDYNWTSLQRAKYLSTHGTEHILSRRCVDPCVICQGLVKSGDLVLTVNPNSNIRGHVKCVHNLVPPKLVPTEPETTAPDYYIPSGEESETDPDEKGINDLYKVSNIIGNTTDDMMNLLVEARSEAKDAHRALHTTLTELVDLTRLNNDLLARLVKYWEGAP